MLLVRSGVVRIIRKNSSHLWKSMWTPPWARTTTEIPPWFHGKFWSSSWPPCCFLHRQKKDFPNVSCRFSCCSPWSCTPAANHSPAGSSNQPTPPTYIYIHTSSAGFILICSSLHILRVSLSFICSENINGDISQLLCSPLVWFEVLQAFADKQPIFDIFFLEDRSSRNVSSSAVEQQQEEKEWETAKC